MKKGSKITLTTDSIQSIRDYNNGTGTYSEPHPYDDYIVCKENDNGINNCESNNAFIDEYIKKGVIIK